MRCVSPGAPRTAHRCEQLNGQTSPTTSRGLSAASAQSVLTASPDRRLAKTSSIAPSIPSGKASDVTAPPQGTRVSLGDDFVIGAVVEHELEVRKIEGESFPPLVQHVPVQVVLGPHQLRRDPTLPQVGAFRSRIDGEIQLIMPSSADVPLFIETSVSGTGCAYDINEIARSSDREDRATGEVYCEAHHVLGSVDLVMTVRYDDDHRKINDARRFLRRAVNVMRTSERAVTVHWLTPAGGPVLRGGPLSRYGSSPVRDALDGGGEELIG